MEPSFTPDERRALLDVARASIAHGLTHHAPRRVTASDFPPPLQLPRAAFVTLMIEGQLRGCIGSLIAHRPLVEDVSENAFAAAFRDPRFGPVLPPEVARLHIHLSILTPPEAMSFTDEQDLLRQIVPGVDGLIFEDHGRRGTFLPAVWESLPDAAEFLAHLKVKAGFDPGYWSRTVKVSRYRAEDVE